MATNNSLNAPLPLSPSQGGTGVANPTANGVLVAQGSGAMTLVSLTDGQLLIGRTGNSPVAANLQAGSGISIVNTPGAITVSSNGDSPWTTVSGTSQSMAPNTGYIANNAALCTLTLPLTAAVGDLIPVEGLGAGGWKIAQNAGQQIIFGATATTSGTGGSLASTNQYDGGTLICVAANALFKFIRTQGNITVI